ncbi:hypothetical protein EV368DRAFT_78037 [Lentinula lateritia]|uniref:Uncharacterized protein n=1 Tax=Lentinula aff. lateritia TaxID=2804960 RepID=A0ACC1UC80_9AGAR|nr:hypothetical protein F5876DRAFT_72791 [Lentinula aff. lateritia]KAJ3857082.1 hypothetical protein EV368DRAFT_78037 [Lentinula lateritia]
MTPADVRKFTQVNFTVHSSRSPMYLRRVSVFLVWGILAATCRAIPFVPNADTNLTVDPRSDTIRTRAQEAPKEFKITYPTSTGKPAKFDKYTSKSAEHYVTKIILQKPALAKLGVTIPQSLRFDNPDHEDLQRELAKIVEFTFENYPYASLDGMASHQYSGSTASFEVVDPTRWISRVVAKGIAGESVFKGVYGELEKSDTDKDVFRYQERTVFIFELS